MFFRTSIILKSSFLLGSKWKSSCSIRDHLGDSLLRGASIPENSIQKVNDLVNGKETILSDLRGDPSNPASLQLACSGSACGQTFRSDIGNNDPAKATVSAKDFKIPVMSAGKKQKNIKRKEVVVIGDLLYIQEVHILPLICLNHNLNNLVRKPLHC